MSIDNIVRIFLEDLGYEPRVVDWDSDVDVYVNSFWLGHYHISIDMEFRFWSWDPFGCVICVPLSDPDAFDIIERELRKRCEDVVINASV
jgi:hypothetical protein